MLYVPLLQVCRMIVDSGERIIRQQLKWVVSEIGNQDPKRSSFFYLINAGCCGEGRVAAFWILWRKKTKSKMGSIPIHYLWTIPPLPYLFPTISFFIFLCKSHPPALLLTITIFECVAFFPIPNQEQEQESGIVITRTVVNKNAMELYVIEKIWRWQIFNLHQTSRSCATATWLDVQAWQMRVRCK